MLISRIASGKLLVALLTIMMAACAESVFSQSYPYKPIRIVTSLPGGSNDFAARLIAPSLSESLGQPVVIYNQPTILTGEIAAGAAPDGYTLLIAGGEFMIGRLLYTPRYDSMKDFTPISTTNFQPNVIIVPAPLPVKSVGDLIALAKSKPGVLNYATGTLGSVGHLATELFKAMAGVDIVRVNYKGSGPALTALLGGEAQLMIVNPSVISPHVKSGRLRALAVTSAQRSDLVPGLPTVAESGVPGFEAVLITGVFTRSGTPAAIVRRLNQEITKTLNRPEIKERFFSAGTEPAASTPSELAAMMKAELARYGKVVKDAGLRTE